jgi:hypothetical protein
MRKCPECGDVYDDSWKVCLKCSSVLTDDLSIPIGKLKDRLKKRHLIRYSVIIFLILYVCIFAIFLMGVMAGSGVSEGSDPSYDSVMSFLFKIVCWPLILLQIYPHIIRYGNEITAIAASLGWAMIGLIVGVLLSVLQRFVKFGKK